MKKDNYFKITDDGKLTTSQLLDKCRKEFKVWSYYDNKELDKQFPAPKKPTTFYYKKVIEADEENKNISANDFEKSGRKGITLRDRILMELAYFEETGQHLDIDNVTTCSGSRCAGGFVPYANRSDDKFSVGHVYPGVGHGVWRVREKLEPLENSQSMEETLKSFDLRLKTLENKLNFPKPITSQDIEKGLQDCLKYVKHRWTHKDCGLKKGMSHGLFNSVMNKYLSEGMKKDTSKKCSCKPELGGCNLCPKWEDIHYNQTLPDIISKLKV